MNLNNFQKEVNKRADLQKLELGHIALSDLKTLDRLMKSAEGDIKNITARETDLMFAEEYYQDTEKYVKEASKKADAKRKDVDKVAAENKKRPFFQFVSTLTTSATS